MNSLDLVPFKELVHQRSGLLFDVMSESGLILSLQKRMMASRIDTLSAYYAHVLVNHAEFDELVSLLTINETYFYREAGQLDLLTQRLLPEYLSRNSELPLRILSAGCSTGEEPYSIAIAILEKFGESAGRMVRIIAGDIDQHALRRARQAHYHDYSFRGMSVGLRERYFTHLPGHGYQLCEQVRDMVEFHPLNLLATKLPLHFADFDVVFFRNVSIYFDPPTRKRILHTLDSVMRQPACLLLGTAETLANDLGVFQLAEEGGQFYFRKQNCIQKETDTLPRKSAEKTASTRALLCKMPRQVTTKPTPVRIGPAESISREKIESVRALVRDKQHVAAMEQIAVLRRAAPEETDLLLLEAYTLLQMRRFTEATELSQRVLERDNWSVDAMMLLGFAAKWQDDPAAAIAHFKKAAYTRPDCWPAHYYLGSLLQETEAAKARREFRTALLQLANQSDPDGGLRLPLNLPVADIRFLCEMRCEGQTERSAHRGA